jgi:hypothetical protein
MSDPIPPFEPSEIPNKLIDILSNITLANEEDSDGEYTIWDALGIESPEENDPICVDTETYTEMICREDPSNPMCREYDV